jgi:septum formation protein
MIPLILASVSPRRSEIMNYFTIPWEIVPHTFDERSLPFKGDREDYVTTLSKEKALNVAKRFPQRTIIGADTIVFHKGSILNKPTTREEAFQMLSTLSNSSHEVLTGIAVYHDGFCSCSYDRTIVHIRPLNEAQITAFLDTSIWVDKAGAYAIQESGSLLVERIEGCYYNVVGLPVIPLSNLLTKIGINLWKHLRPHRPRN